MKIFKIISFWILAAELYASPVCNDYFSSSKPEKSFLDMLAFFGKDITVNSLENHPDVKTNAPFSIEYPGKLTLTKEGVEKVSHKPNMNLVFYARINDFGQKSIGMVLSFSNINGGTEYIRIDNQGRLNNFDSVNRPATLEKIKQELIAIKQGKTDQEPLQSLQRSLNQPVQILFANAQRRLMIKKTTSEADGANEILIVFKRDGKGQLESIDIEYMRPTSRRRTQADRHYIFESKREILPVSSP